MLAFDGYDSKEAENSERNAKILKQDPSDLSNRDVFFDLGGDSISALDLVSAAWHRGIFLTVEEVFMHTTIEDMAAIAKLVEPHANQGLGGDTLLNPFALLGFDSDSVNRTIAELAQICGVLPEQIENAYPCTPMQESLVAATEGSENAYLLQMVYDIQPETPLDIFRKAWELSVRDDPVLRTRICHIENKGFFQCVIDENLSWNVVETDIRLFLQDDAALLTRPGSPLFRYSIVYHGGKRYFVWTIHHALCDGTSVIETLEDVSRRFANQPTEPYQPYDQYVHFVMTRDVNNEREFWRRHLSKLSPASFPLLPHPDFEARPTSHIRRRIAVHQNGQSGITIPLLLRAAWALLLSCHTGSDQVTFGAIVNGRGLSNVPRTSHFAGPTICLLPIVLQVDPEESVTSFLKRVKDQAAKMMAFETTGIRTIRNYLSNELSSACDFQCLFVVHPEDFESTATPALQRLGLKIVPDLGKSEEHAYPLVFSVSISTMSAVSVHLQYDDRVISVQQANNLINQFQVISKQLGESNDRSLVGSVTALNEEDLAQIRRWNKDTPRGIEKCFYDLFEEQVYKHPNSTALCSSEENLTYAEVQNITASLSLRLKSLGVSPGTFVAVCFEKSIWAIIAILAVFKAGGTYVPIDPSYPQGRINEIAQMTQLHVAVVSQSTIAVLEGVCHDLVCLDNMPMSFIPEKRGNCTNEIVRPSDTAYLLFTSGTTGKPKGVMISHSALCTGMVSQAQAFGFGPGTRMLQSASYTFDASILEIFATLLVGGTLCIPSESDRLNNLSGAIASLEVNTVVLTSTVLNLMSPEQIPTVKDVILGGEPVHRDIIRKWAHCVKLTNGYGPSETTVCCGANIGVTVETDPSNIGRSIGAMMWIVRPDRHDQLSAIGAVGEIVVSGALLAKGYHGDRTMTEISFVDAPRWLMDMDPYSPFKTIYKTGDLARYNSDGTLQYMGRKDSQVKLRGFRIELGEIEARIMQHEPNSKTTFQTTTLAVALLPEQGPLRAQIVAVLSFNQSESSLQLGTDAFEFKMVNQRESGTIQEQLKKTKSNLASHLPGYMVPTVWIVLKELPLLVSGKINRKAIKLWIYELDSEVLSRMLEDNIADAKANLEALSSDSPIRVLREIWGDVLNIPTERIGSNTSFYSLGGDSISAIQIVNKAKTWGIYITVRSILAGKSLGSLVPLLKHKARTSEVRDEPQLPDGLFELSPIQKLFVAANRTQIQTARFHQMLILRLQKPLPVEILVNAVLAVMRKHPMLRATFPKEYNWERQRIADDVQEKKQIRYHGEVDEAQVRHIIESAHNSIAVDTGPTFCTDIYRISENTFTLFTAHHLVVDVVSWRLISQDLEDFVSNGSLTAQSSWSFYQWTETLKAHFGGKGEAAKLLQQAPEEEVMGFFSSLETDSQKLSEPTTRARWALNKSSTSELLRIANQEYLAQPAEVMIAAVAKSFSDVFGRACPAIFVEGHGREPMDINVDLSSTIGWFTVLYPIAHFPVAVPIIDFIDYVKTSRRRYPDNGLEYFSRRIFNLEGTADLDAMDWLVQFNYEGVYQQVDNKKSFFERVNYDGIEDTLIGPNVKRLGTIQIEATIRDGQLRFSISFPENLRHADLIFKWFQEIKANLECLNNSVPKSRVLSHSISAHTNNNYIEDEEPGHVSTVTSLIAANAENSNIQNAYSCSPMQSLIFEHQVTDPSCYLIAWELEITNHPPLPPIDLERVVRCWKRIVKRHPILRTRFLPKRSETGDRVPVQVVSNDFKAKVDVDTRISDFEGNIGWGDPKTLHELDLPHRIRFCQRGDGVVGYLEANHLILDGWSLGLIKEEFLALYTSEQDLSHHDSKDCGPEYQPFIAAHESSRSRRDLEYWRNILHSVRPSILPLPLCSADLKENEQSILRTVIPVQSLSLASLGEFSRNHDVTIASIFDAAWAQTIGHYTQSREVIFGYVVSGRDSDDVPEVVNIVGPLINIIPYHLRDVTLEDSPFGLARLSRRVQDQRTRDSAHTLCGFLELPETLLGSKQLFNTVVNFQRRSSSHESGGVRLRELARSKDPWHFDILVRVIINDEIVRTQLEFNVPRIKIERLQEIADFFLKRVSVALPPENKNASYE